MQRHVIGKCLSEITATAAIEYLRDRYEDQFVHYQDGQHWLVYVETSKDWDAAQELYFDGVFEAFLAGRRSMVS
jgi:hypothetical protein